VTNRAKLAERISEMLEHIPGNAVANSEVD
jgi:hypothetical protein